jgi:hypothetical protein
LILRKGCLCYLFLTSFRLCIIIINVLQNGNTYNLIFIS